MISTLLLVEKLEKMTGKTVILKEDVRKSLTYEFRSPVLYSIVDESDQEKLADAPFDYKEAMQEMVDDWNSEEMFRYYDAKRVPTEAITKITAEADGTDFVMKVIANRNLTDQELEGIKSWLSGQYSDGWGEGYEQQFFDYEGYEVRIHPWGHDEDWDIQIVKPAIEDFPEENLPANEDLYYQHQELQKPESEL